jgi:hypothetical protein
MAIYGKKEAAFNAGDPEYLEALRLYEEAAQSFKPLYEVTQAANLRVLAALFEVGKAAECFNATLENEISVAPTCKCECKGS